MEESERQICALEKEVAVQKQQITDSALAVVVAREVVTAKIGSLIAVLLALAALINSFRR